MNRITIKDLVVPGMLLVLSLVPMYGGIVRLRSLSAGATVDNARFVAAPTPVVLHIASATPYAMLGAFQFSGAVRRRWPGWHRGAGMVLTLCGLLAGLTGMWMAVAYRIPQGLQGPVLLGVRMLVGTAIVMAIVLAWLAIRRRDVSTHGTWMLRAYALAQGAGTQALVLGPWVLLRGETVGLTRDLLMTLAWVINLAVAEWIIRRCRKGPRRHARRQSLVRMIDEAVLNTGSSARRPR